MNAASALDTRPDFRNRRFRPRDFFVMMWPALQWLRLILPLAVLRNRLAAPRCDFAFFPTLIFLNPAIPAYRSGPLLFRRRQGLRGSFSPVLFRRFHLFQNRFSGRQNLMHLIAFHPRA